MRIISGSARGTNIKAPAGLDTRPVTDKIRQSLFNIWQFDIPDSRFLDLFSGSGSMGLEALSRGAKEVIMVEKGKEAAKVIIDNIKTCHFENKNQQLYQEDVFTVIPKLKAQNKKFDFIYLDPPYTVDEIFHPVMEALGDGELLDPDGILVIRTKKEKDMRDEYGNLEKYREKVYGISKAHFYRLKDTETKAETESDPDSKADPAPAAA